MDGVAALVLLVGFAIFSQFQWNLQPCPLCIFQRIAFAALALVLLVACLHAPKGATGRCVYGVLALVPALAGIAIAARHVWLTHLPADQVPACGPPLSFMMEVNPMPDVNRQVLNGSGGSEKHQS